MTESPTYLITGAGGGVAGIGSQVVAQLLDRGQPVRAMVHHDDSRADALRALGADVIVGDLTSPVDVLAAMSGITRMFFNMSVSPHMGAVYELTGPATLDLDGLADQYSQALGRPVTVARPSYDEWLEVLGKVGLPPYVRQHIATMAKPHRADRYNRSTDTVAEITGHPAQTVRAYVELHRDLFG